MNFLPLAFNTHREAIRDKILYVILLFAVMMISASILLSYLSLNQEAKMVVDLGLSCMNIFGLLITIFVGTTLLTKEIDRKTVFLLLPKPLRRSEFILGKYLGLCLTLFVITLAMSLTFFAVLWYITRNLDAIAVILVPSLEAIVCIYVEMMVLTALAIFFSSFSSSVMSAAFTICMYIIGHLTQDIVKFGSMTGSQAITILTQVLYYILPDLERLNLKNQILFDKGINFEVFSSSLAYGLLYTLVLLVMSMLIFEGREF